MKRKTITLAIVTIILSVIIGLFLFQWPVTYNDVDNEESILEYTFNQEIEAVLSQKIAILSTLAESEVMVNGAKKSNENNKKLLRNDFIELDNYWRENNEKSVTKLFLLSNDISKTLKDFVLENPEFFEIFSTDKFGMNTGLTNLTTDYYQADENWWVVSYNRGEGKKFHGPIEFDDSSGTEAISIYVPIYDPETELVIGVIKGVVAIQELDKDLLELTNEN